MVNKRFIFLLLTVWQFLYFKNTECGTTLAPPSIKENNDPNIGYFWQLTDFHLEPDYLKKGCKGELGDYVCDSPYSLVKSAINEAKKIKGDPDFIVWSGDGGPHRSTSQEELFLIVSNITLEMKAAFPGVKILPMVGNHDTSPANRLSPIDSDVERKNWCTRLSSIWKSFFHDEIEENRFANNCYHSMPIFDPSNRIQYRLVALNGLIWYLNNPLAKPTPAEEQDPSSYDPLGQFAWLESIFKEARDQDYKVILSSHFPPGASENTPLQFRHMWPIANEKLLNLLIDYSDVITTYLAAHEHADSFRVIYSQNKPVSTVLLAPSVTTFHLSGLGATNPRIRLFKYDKKTSVLKTFQQYKVNVASTDNRWDFDYDAASSYNLASLTASELDALVKSFQVSNQYWQSYYDRELGGYTHENYPTCNGLKDTCRCNHLCSMQYQSYSEMDNCLSSGACGRDIGPTSSSPTTRQSSSSTLLPISTHAYTTPKSSSNIMQASMLTMSLDFLTYAAFWARL